jgi:NAD(P)-dependent dehydrogenase (short-subunit alcohol dehydrogenase family)
MEQLTLTGKTALVTGASQGIGMACARALAHDGGTVVIMGRNEESLAKARAELNAQIPGTRVEMFVGDASREDLMKSALGFAHRLNDRLDIVVSTVGAPTFMPLLMRDLDGVRREFEVNFMTAFLAVRYGVPLMERGGAIVCVSTAVVTQANWGLSIYGSAKAALERFVRAAALELGGAGIRVNAVRPGATLSRERAESPELSGMAQAFVAETPMGRIGHPDDIARVVRFLAGPDSGWVTGQTFSADGGMDQGKGPDFTAGFFGKEVMDRIRAGKPVDRS